MTTGTGIRRRMGVEERREQLIAVALDLFGSRPPEDVSIDQIAEAAGISRPLVYHYFPNKQSLYEAAVGRAGDELARRFSEPPEGPLGTRLLRVMHRFFDFVEHHGAGFSSLMRGAPAAAPAPVGGLPGAGGSNGPGGAKAPVADRVGAVVGQVRQVAYEQILGHLGVEEPSPRMEMMVRSWLSLTETTALLWLGGCQVPRDELELQLVHDFAALAAVSAAYDQDMAKALLPVLSNESTGSPFAELAVRLATDLS